MSAPLNVTYLIGAGASAPDLPITKQIPDRIDILKNWIATSFPMPPDTFASQERLTGTYLDAQNLLFRNLDSLKLHAQRHYSVDTFAKKLYIQQSSVLTELKATLSAFFMLEQIRTGLHQRYDTFFAALIAGKQPDIKLPSNVSILNWNYDSQFEIAFSRYSGSPEYVHTHMQATPLPERIKHFDPQRFSLVHLNGAAGFHAANGTFLRLLSLLTAPTSTASVSEVFLFYTKYIQQTDSFEPLINFAWETDHPLPVHQLKHALQVAPRTDILTVIGYSFPQFNREIDRNLIGSMTNLRKVYIQAPKDDLPAYKQKVSALIYPALVNVPIMLRDDLDQFVIPEEF